MEYAQKVKVMAGHLNRAMTNEGLSRSEKAEAIRDYLNMRSSGPDKAPDVVLDAFEHLLRQYEGPEDSVETLNSAETASRA